MGQWSKRIAIMAAAGMLAVSTMTGCGASLNADETVATVGEDKISVGVANFYARMQQAQYETYYAAMMGMTAEELWAQEIDEGVDYEDSVKDSVLETLENMYLMKQHAEEYGVSISDDEQKAIEKAAEDFDENNALEAKEAVSGYQKYVEELLTLIQIQNKMNDAMVADVDTEVSDEEAAQKSMKYVLFSYTITDEEGNSVTLTDDEKTALKDTAQAFVDDLKAGGDIDTLAEAVSEQDITVQTLTFDSESTSPSEDLIQAVDALAAAGDVTDVIETDSGLYVAQLESLFDEEATESEKESIVQQRKQDRYNELLEQWKEETEITVHEKVWDKVDFSKQGVTIMDTTVDEEATDDTTDTAAEVSASDDTAEEDDTADDAADEE